MASADLVRESQDPSTTAARLAELAQIDRGLWPAIAVHPAAYPTLLDWLGQQGDPTVNAVLALRAGSGTAAPAAPTAPPAPPVGQTEPTAATYAAPAPLGTTSGVTSNNSNSKNVWVVGGMVAVVLLLIGGVAFGATKVFDGDDGKDEASPALTVDAPELDDPPTVGAPDTESEGDSDDSTVEAFCEGFKEARTALAGQTDSAPGSDTVRSIADIMGDIAATAPAEIKSEMGVMAEYFEAMSDPSTLDTSKISERVEAFTTAGKKVSTYYSTNCM